MPNQDIAAVQRGQEYFRLKQTVQSPGDIYELAESTKALYIGPDSDIAEVQVTYFNPDAPNLTSLETAVVSVNGPFVGRVDALNVTTVPTTGQPARILVSPVDIVDNAYVPPGSLALRRFNIPAQLDLIAALRELPSIPEVRADRTLRFPQVPYRGQGVGADDGSTDLLVPIYGRRMTTVQVIGNGIDVNFFLVNLLPGNPTIPRGVGTLHLAATIPVVKTVQAAVFRASDAARQGVNQSAAFAITGYYEESDQPPKPAGGITSSPAVRGMADLLYINIVSVVPGAVTRFADVFVKVADRET